MFLSQTGFSLIEVMLATCVLCLGVLGFERVTMLALQNNEIAYFQSLANTQLNAMSESIRACAATENSTTCVKNASESWKADNETLLPHAQSNLKASKHHYTLSIHWQSQVANATATATV